MYKKLAKLKYLPNNFEILEGGAHFVRCTATGGTQTIEVRSEDSTVLGQVYLHAAGDTVIIEKHPNDKITMADGHASAVGSPRS